MRRLVQLSAVVFAAGCSALFTAPPPEGDDFETPFDDLSPELNRAFLAGDEGFEREFTVSDGLGPLYNDRSCAACHPGDGPGRPENVLIRFSFDGDPGVQHGGPQLQDRAIRGEGEALPEDAQWSPRRPPPVFGMGLIEAIPADAILANADPDDEDGDGISGRPNFVMPSAFVPVGDVGWGTEPQLGRFGLKANIASLVEQVVFAYQQDMGITSDFLPEENYVGSWTTWADDASDPELSGAEVMNTVAYVRLLQPPARGEQTEQTKRGEALFGEVGCADCHIPTLRTGPSPLAALANRDVPLYSDLLLHDMGPDLADGRGDGEADGNEWRTTPLWGTRIGGDFNGGPFFLHDGRARTVADAVALHGGEGEASRDAFDALSGADREALVAFVESL